MTEELEKYQETLIKMREEIDDLFASMDHEYTTVTLA